MFAEANLEASRGVEPRTKGYEPKMLPLHQLAQFKLNPPLPRSNGVKAG